MIIHVCGNWQMICVEQITVCDTKVFKEIFHTHLFSYELPFKTFTEVKIRQPVKL